MLNHVGTRPLETDRLVLRQHEISDAEDMYRNWVTDPAVSRFWQWEPHQHVDETKALLAGWIEDYAKPDYYHWIIVLKSVGQAVGYLFLSDIDNDGDSVSVHYALSRQYWKQGIMTEALNRVLDFAFTVMGVRRVHTSHHIDNPASGRVLEKCGMRHIKTAHKHVPEYEPISGLYCYYELTDHKQQRSAP